LSACQSEFRTRTCAKAFTGHAAIEVVSESLQMSGAADCSGDLPLQRMLRDVRVFQIGGGISQAL